MVKIVELAGMSHVFTLKDGSTFRLMSHSSKDVKSSLLTEEFSIAEKRGIILIVRYSDVKKPVEPVSKKEAF